MNLKKFRNQAGKSQQEMANILNMSQTGYNAYETGKCEPNIQTLIKLADHYGTTIDSLVGHNVPYLIDKSQFNETQLSIINAIQQCSEDTNRRIEAYALGALMAEEERKKVIALYKTRRDDID